VFLSYVSLASVILRRVQGRMSALRRLAQQYVPSLRRGFGTSGRKPAGHGHKDGTNEAVAYGDGHHVRNLL
jgi:hypothetical protein